MVVLVSTDDARRSGPAPAIGPFIEFEVKRRLKLWVVMRDDIYVGGYPEEVGAVVAAEREVNAVIQGGGKARMRTEPSGS